MDALAKGPDGIRTVGGKLLLAENCVGKIGSLVVARERNHAIAERGAGKALSNPMPQ
jgi:hypothetical protein